jgi:hypothetical protein
MAFVAPDACRIKACPAWRDLEARACLARAGIWFAAGDDKPWLFRRSLRQLAQRRGGYFEDIQYVRSGRQRAKSFGIPREGKKIGFGSSTRRPQA